MFVPRQFYRRKISEGSLSFLLTATIKRNFSLHPSYDVIFQYLRPGVVALFIYVEVIFFWNLIHVYIPSYLSVYGDLMHQLAVRDILACASRLK